MLTMLKVAAGFVWLDGRTDKITDGDCELARIVMAISDCTRTHTQRALDAMTNRSKQTHPPWVDWGGSRG